MAPGARLAIAAGAVLGALAVAAGAFAAHALRATLAPEALSLVETASRYQFIHALALVAVGLFQIARPSRLATASAIGFATGAVLFCGSLYALAFGAPRALGMVTPVGGILLMAGWALFATAALRSGEPKA